MKDIWIAKNISRETWALTCLLGQNSTKPAPVGKDLMAYFQEDYEGWSADDLKYFN